MYHTPHIIHHHVEPSLSFSSQDRMSNLTNEIITREDYSDLIKTTSYFDQWKERKFVQSITINIQILYANDLAIKRECTVFYYNLKDKIFVLIQWVMSTKWKREDICLFMWESMQWRQDKLNHWYPISVLINQCCTKDIKLWNKIACKEYTKINDV
jgi:hypothetical protein